VNKKSVNLVFSFGNKKLPKTTAIFNLCPSFCCPSRNLNLCQLTNPQRCYALKAERLHPQVLGYRKRQFKFWKKCTVDSFFWKLAEEKGTRKIDILRVSEAGDFRDQEDVDKLVSIANKLSYCGVKTYCYTARSDLNFSNRGELVVNGSNFMVDNCFKMGTFVKGVDETYAQYKCIMDCRKCSLCSEKGGKTIYVKMH